MSTSPKAPKFQHLMPDGSWKNSDSPVSPKAQPQAKAAHTPGPWGWHRVVAPADSIRKFDLHVTGDGITVAHIHGDESKHQGSAEANARFIAAAPELLAEGKQSDELLTALYTAANRVLEIFNAQYLRAYDDGGRVRDAMNHLNAALAEASSRHSRLAIAKAEGRA